MTVLVTVLQTVTPVFLLALIGVVWVRLGYDYSVQFVTRMAMSLSVPCLIFTALMNTEIEREALLATVWATVAAYGGVTALFWGLCAATGLSIRTYLAPLIFGNTGNLGLPLALFAFGDAGLGYAVVIFALMGIYSFTVGIWIVSGGASLMRLVQEPLVAATVLGLVFMWQGWRTPLWATNTLTLIGQMAIPLMLITLGVALARLTPERLIFSVGLSAVKIAVCAGVAFAAGTYFSLQPVALAVLVLQVSTPVAVTSYLLAEKYGAQAEEVAGLVVVSTLLSVATLPITLAFFL
ncbi:MAG: AEC family transporter [Pseudomonadota bacterium]